MKIHILGCHGSDGLLRGDHGRYSCHTCGFLVNDVLMIDAGTVASKLPIEAQGNIRHILLSHLHFDHIKGLPTFADNVSEQAGPPVVVAAIPEVMQGLHEHIFNNRVYPDFFQIPPDNPILASHTVTVGKADRFGEIEVTPVFVNHTVPTTGFILQDRGAALLYSGDTAPTDELWRIATHHPRLKAAFIECSYPNAQEHLAQVSKHLTPRLFVQELDKLSRSDVAIYAYHLKPIFKDEIVKELRSLGIPKLSVLEEGETIEI